MTGEAGTPLHCLAALAAKKGRPGFNKGTLKEMRKL